MPNMKLQHSRGMASLILQGMISDSDELRETVIYKLTPKQLKMLEQVAANIRIIQNQQAR